MILSHSDSELKDLPEKLISDIVDQLEVLLRASSMQDDAYEIVEKFKLKLIPRYLTCDALQKRVRALNDLNSFIKKVAKRRGAFGEDISDYWLDASYVFGLSELTIFCQTIDCLDQREKNFGNYF